MTQVAVQPLARDRLHGLDHVARERDAVTRSISGTRLKREGPGTRVPTGPDLGPDDRGSGAGPRVEDAQRKEHFFDVEEGDRLAPELELEPLAEVRLELEVVLKYPSEYQYPLNCPLKHVINMKCLISNFLRL